MEYASDITNGFFTLEYNTICKR